MRRLMVDVRPLRRADFRRLWLGTTVSAVGGAMTGFAVTLQVFRLTHSSAAVGAIGLALALPVVLFAMYGGSVADATDRRRLVLVTSSGLAVVSALLAAQAVADLGQVWLLYLLVAVQSLLVSVDAPARRTMVPRLLPTDEISAGMALNKLAFQLSLTVGPVVGGAVVALAGLQACYALDVLTFAASIYGVARLPAMLPKGDTARPPGARAVREGLQYVIRSPVLRTAFLADLDAMVLGMPFALLPAINAAHFGGHAQTLGLLSAAPGVGGLVASVLSGPVTRVGRQGRGLLVAVAVWGAAVAGFGLTTRWWPALLLLAVAGAADTWCVVFRATIAQVAAPDRLRGRVTAADYVVGATGAQFGNVRAGLVGSLATPAIAAVSGGLLVMAGAAALALLTPSFLRYDVRDGEASAAETRANEP